MNETFSGSAIISLPCERCGSVINTLFDFNAFAIDTKSSSTDGECFDTDEITIRLTYDNRNDKQTIPLPLVHDEAGYNHILCRRCAELYNVIRDEYRGWLKASHSDFVDELDKAGLSFMKHAPRWR